MHAHTYGLAYLFSFKHCQWRQKIRARAPRNRKITYEILTKFSMTAKLIGSKKPSTFCRCFSIISAVPLPVCCVPPHLCWLWIRIHASLTRSREISKWNESILCEAPRNLFSAFFFLILFFYFCYSASHSEEGARREHFFNSDKKLWLYNEDVMGL